MPTSGGHKIHYYQFGNHTPYVIIGINPNFKHYPLLYAYNGGDVTKVTAFSERHFGRVIIKYLSAMSQKQRGGND